MAALASVFLKLLPIYFLIFLGFVAGKFIKLDKKTIGTYIVYLLSPAIVFNGTYRTHLTPSILTFPILFYILCNSICLISWLLAKPIWADKTRNLLAFSAGFSNIGYFGLPTAIALLGPQAEGLVALILLALQLFISTTGLFVAALGNLSPGKSLVKIIKYALYLCICSRFVFQLFPNRIRSCLQ
jgi:predicted permease